MRRIVIPSEDVNSDATTEEETTGKENDAREEIATGEEDIAAKEEDIVRKAEPIGEKIISG